MNQFGFLKGITFTFNHETHVIESWFSVFSGLEKVKVNNEIVAKHRNYSTNSEHFFEIDRISYNTSLEMKSLLKGPFVCSLFENGTLIKQNKLIFQNENYKKPWYGQFWFLLIMAIIITIPLAYYKLHIVFQCLISFSIIFLLAMFSLRNKPRQKPIFQEVNIEDI